MANRLNMAQIQAIEQLQTLKWSQRKIARELGIDRGAVARHLRGVEKSSKAAIPPTGSSDPKAATFPPAPGTFSIWADRAGCAASETDSKAAIPPTGSLSPIEADSTVFLPSDPTSSESHTKVSPAGRHSQCETYREVILAKLDQRLSAQRIWQDLVADHGFTGKYDSVKRFVRRLIQRRPLPFRRMEVPPGEEAQVDFGAGAWVVAPDGRRRKTHVFRIVLSYSRKAYSESTFTQTTDEFLRALENAFHVFGGVPKTLVIDNLKAAVTHPDWFDPELTPKVQSFCRHYGTVILPTKPYMPRHKGKVESGVKYVQSNALKGRTFPNNEAQNRFLANWETGVADTRIHGTTKRQVAKLFEEERSSLLPLPLERFASFHEAQRKVSRDGHVEVAKAYYSMPPEYLGRTVWVRWDARLVRIFNQRFEQIALHVRHEQGRFSTQAEHVAPEKINRIERGAAYLLGKIAWIGPQSQQWAEAMLHARGIEGTRVLQGLLSLTRKHSAESLEKACEIALSHGAFRLRTIRKLLDRKAEKQQSLPFLDEHPIIRPMDDYGRVVAAAIRRQDDRRHDGGSGFLRDDEDVRGEMKKGPRETLPLGHGTLSTRPRSGYSSSGCSSAEPESASPDHSNLHSHILLHKEPTDE
ncbi:MAG: IS21 family transposase [Kiritimatiellae bacterium]|nr:IS21 family transposase [Kiritimatiellia bacterium]